MLDSHHHVWVCLQPYTGCCPFKCVFLGVFVCALHSDVWYISWPLQWGTSNTEITHAYTCVCMYATLWCLWGTSDTEITHAYTCVCVYMLHSDVCWEPATQKLPMLTLVCVCMLHSDVCGKPVTQKWSMLRFVCVCYILMSVGNHQHRNYWCLDCRVPGQFYTNQAHFWTRVNLLFIHVLRH